MEIPARLEKLDAKVDSVKEDVAELKTEFRLHVQETKHHMGVIKDHVAGDNKIITEIQPLLSELPHMVEIIKDWKFSKELEKRRNDTIVKVTKLIALISGISGTIFSLYRWIL